MFLLVGLGNPGAKYANTRHNVGFLVIERLVECYGLAGDKSKFNAICNNGQIADHKVVCIRPQTYMNDSGVAVASARSFYKVDLANVIVFYDDLDLVSGKVKGKVGGGSGGHNGIKSISGHIGDGYVRIKVGIDHPGDRGRVSSYVLGDLDEQQSDVILSSISSIADNLPILLDGDLPLFLSKVRSG